MKSSEFTSNMIAGIRCTNGYSAINIFQRKYGENEYSNLENFAQILKT